MAARRYLDIEGKPLSRTDREFAARQARLNPYSTITRKAAIERFAKYPAGERALIRKTVQRERAVAGNIKRKTGLVSREDRRNIKIEFGIYRDLLDDDDDFLMEFIEY